VIIKKTIKKLITDKIIIITDIKDIFEKHDKNTTEIFDFNELRKKYSEEFRFLRENISEFELYVNLSIMNLIKKRMMEISKYKNYETVIFYKEDVTVDFIKWVDSIKDEYKNNFKVVLHIKNQIDKNIFTN